jgi:LysR family transcriptional regulator, hca operon transcriptional activator
MELRHIRYFVAVAEEGSLTVAAERRLHTSQPSLSRQIRDLELEIGAPLLMRSVHGVELTPAGKAFLDHARLALVQVEAAREAARRASHPGKPSFALGFLTGQEMDWLPEAMHLLRDELLKIDVTVTSEYSPVLADALLRGKIDLAFMRREAHATELQYRTVTQEALLAILPSDHRFAQNDSVDLREIASEPFVSVSGTAPALRKVIDDYIKAAGIAITPAHEADNLAMAISLVASRRGFALLPRYARNFLPWSVVGRPIKGDAPRIDLVVGYHKANRSTTLKLFLSKLDQLIERVGGVERDRKFS